MHTKTIQKIQKAYIKTYEEDVQIYKDIENSQGQGAFFFENTGIITESPMSTEVWRDFLQVEGLNTSPSESNTAAKQEGLAWLVCGRPVLSGGYPAPHLQNMLLKRLRHATCPLRLCLKSNEEDLT